MKYHPKYFDAISNENFSRDLQAHKKIFLKNFRIFSAKVKLIDYHYLRKILNITESNEINANMLMLRKHQKLEMRKQIYRTLLKEYVLDFQILIYIMENNSETNEKVFEIIFFIIFHPPALIFKRTFKEVSKCLKEEI